MRQIHQNYRNCRFPYLGRVIAELRLAILADFSDVQGGIRGIGRQIF
jgi:hypothetical protein